MEANITERLTFFASLFEIDQNPEQGMWYLYVTVLILSVIVYKLGFARELTLLKNIVIYISLAFGCTILTFFAAFSPSDAPLPHEEIIATDTMQIRVVKILFIVIWF